ncbi:hypothetical protein N7E81_10120 [Reichenbachiella carrageenanivorans]|uniref:Novel STAND NTPase 1 domain-containing protein n=1 Tax=Reichenbachiella carrageenanivorans TaxID=2979869 RepID=A0ABY6CVG1_9BACT|nr:hypothetical protein [Reichenbachiella carrageenanivorans]UXX77724.1 hypothetical protein N7E81_10120 [Reichenbachiella carrageenanivorans]
MPTTETPITTSKISNPFPGLRPFKSDEAELFFGRETQVDYVIKQIKEKGFIAVIGASGVGKSSFMSCGVLSDMINPDTNDKDRWNVMSITPGHAPTRSLARGIYNSILKKDDESDNDASKTEEKIDKLERTIWKKPERLFKLLNGKLKKNKKKHLLFIDQFEEVFRFAQESNDAYHSVKTLMDLLTATIAQKEMPVHIVIAIRADFIGDCARFPQLTSAINSSQYLIPQLTREEKEKAIRGPIHFMNAKVEDDLVEKILDEVGDDSDQLPIMQHALMRTFDYWKKNQSGEQSIAISDYEAIGGMKNALSKHAREAYGDLNHKELQLCKRIFKCITEKGEDGRGVRRPTTLKDISQIVGASKEEVVAIVEQFRRPGRSLLLPSGQIKFEDDTIIDISHESLMRNWVELAEWVDEEAESVKLYLSLATAAAMHQEGKEGLWTPPGLLLAQNWKKEQQPTMHWGLRYDPAYERTILFLDHSDEEYERKKRINERNQKRKINNARKFGTLMLFVCFCAFVAFYYASEESERAELETLKALEAQKKAVEEGEKAEISAIKAEKSAEKARKAQSHAMTKKLEAELAKLEADSMGGIAIQNAEEAKSLRLRSLGKAMAIKSLQITTPEKEGYVASLAYQFNQSNHGTANDPDIYDGLYYALKALNTDPERFDQTKHDQNVRALISSAKNECIYSTGSDGTILKWDINGNQSNTTTISQSKGVKVNKSLALSPDENRLACGGLFRYIEEYDLSQSDDKPKTIPTNWTDTWFLSYTKDGKLLAVGSSNKIMLLSDGVFVPLSDGENKINALTIDPGSNSVLAAQENGQLVRYFLDGSTPPEVIIDQSIPLYAVQFSPNATYLAVGDEEGKIHLYNGKDQTLPPKILRVHNARVNQIVFDQAGKIMASGSFDKTVRMWDLEHLDDAPIILRDHDDWVWSIVFTHDGSNLWAGSRDYHIKTWPTKTHDMAIEICDLLGADLAFSDTDWKHYVGEDIARPETSFCTTYN